MTDYNKSKPERRYEHDPILTEIEGTKLIPRPILTMAETEKLKAKVEATCKHPSIEETAKYQTGSNKLKWEMKHAAHLRRLRTLRGIWNPDENEL